MMPKTNMRLLCLFLSLLLAFSALSGCAGEATTQTTEPSKESDPPSDTVTDIPEPEPVELAMTLPTEERFMTLDESITFEGVSDTRHPLTINGFAVERDEDGLFSYKANLELGANDFTVVHQDKTLTYRIERRHATEFYTQAEDTHYNSGARMYLKVFAKEGSTVTAKFRDQEKAMNENLDQLACGASEGFILYTAHFDMPAHNKTEQDLGYITYSVTYNDVTDVFTSGKITCAPRVEVKLSDKEATPDEGGYINVGSGYVVEVIDENVETFRPWTTDDYSYPTYNYLPKGTQDYASETIIYDNSGEKTYMLLRCGVRVYRMTKNTPNPKQSMVVDCYTGTLPDHNEIGFNPLTVVGHHTYLTLDSLWKAPFFFDFEPQEYADPSQRRYTLKEFNATWIDIRFCYATKISGSWEVPADNPLFERAELTQNGSDCTLRLYLKKAGGLYGWDAYYNEHDQLVFRFLNPVKVTKADNAYGADLTGVRVMLDIGHGGLDIGAAGRDSNGLGWTENERNWILSNLVREELESIGATVIMNRNALSETTTQRERIRFLRQQAPDYTLCIHHNSNIDKTFRGYETGYFTSFTQQAADHMTDAVSSSKLYVSTLTMWFFYYVSRQTTCPIVLTENGYMSNVRDMDAMINPEVLRLKAQALTKGIVNYYLDLNDLT